MLVERDRRREREQLGAHVVAQRRTGGGVGEQHRRGLGHHVERQPVGGEALERSAGPPIGEHAIDLHRERVVVEPGVGGREQLVVGHVVPQHTGQTRGELVIGERSDAGRQFVPLRLDEVEERRVDEQRQQQRRDTLAHALAAPDGVVRGQPRAIVGGQRSPQHLGSERIDEADQARVAAGVGAGRHAREAGVQGRERDVVLGELLRERVGDLEVGRDLGEADRRHLGREHAGLGDRQGVDRGPDRRDGCRAEDRLERVHVVGAAHPQQARPWRHAGIAGRLHTIVTAVVATRSALVGAARRVAGTVTAGAVGAPEPAVAARQTQREQHRARNRPRRRPRHAVPPSLAGARARPRSPSG